MPLVNKLILHPAFKETIEEISRVSIYLPPNPSNFKISYDDFTGPSGGKLINIEDEIKRYNLNAENGEKKVKDKVSFAGYDESILKYIALEGIAYFTSHSLVIAGYKEYVPVDYITFYFYTRSKAITEKSKHIKYAENIELESKRDYIKDKINFLNDYSPQKSILFIDGPLIGGDLYTYMIQSVEGFLCKNIIPIFFIKNSESNLVTENIVKLRGKYNSDMHWSYNFLKIGQRTNFFKYEDKQNPRNAKIFCYLKAYNLSPQRIEFHIDIFNKYKDQITNIMDIIYYLILVQGDKKNPQLRPIAIAEKYARETLGMINIYKLMKESGLIPTMNQERFGG